MEQTSHFPLWGPRGRPKIVEADFPHSCWELPNMVASSLSLEVFKEKLNIFKAVEVIVIQRQQCIDLTR